MKKNKKLLFLSIGGIICLFLVIGVSFALWQLTLNQTGENIVTTGCFKVVFEEGGNNGINLSNAYPISDIEGNSYEPYTFTIKNECSETVKYFVNLETTTKEAKILPEQYIKASLIEQEKVVFLDTLKDSYRNTEKVITDASNAYKLTVGKLEGNEEKTYHLRLWLDESTPPIDEVMDASYKGKITISSSFIPPMDPNRTMIARNENDTNNYEFMEQSHKIIFQNALSPIKDITPVDISKNKTNTVLAYVDDTNPEEIITYIEADGNIYFPEDSTSFFADYNNLQAIEGLSSTNTTYVTNMNNMFAHIPSLTSLDLQSFDTSNVTNMNSMFAGCKSLTTINLSSFDTRKVTDMTGMFGNAGFGNLEKLETLDIKHFNTENVTNMDNMFDGLISVTKLDLGGWNTSKVTTNLPLFQFSSSLTELNISGWDITNLVIYLGSCTNLKSINASGIKFTIENLNLMLLDIPENIEKVDISNLDFSNIDEAAGISLSIKTNYILKNWDLSKFESLSNLFTTGEAITLDVSGWNTKNVTDMSFLFHDFANLESLDLSDFVTSNVTNMSAMFMGCTNLKTINMSHFNTSNVIEMYGMFEACVSLTTINYGNNFIHNSNCTVDSMFEGCEANKPTHSSWNGVTF